MLITPISYHLWITEPQSSSSIYGFCKRKTGEWHGNMMGTSTLVHQSLRIAPSLSSPSQMWFGLHVFWLVLTHRDIWEQLLQKTDPFVRSWVHTSPRNTEGSCLCLAHLWLSAFFLFTVKEAGRDFTYLIVVIIGIGITGWKHSKYKTLNICFTY